MESRFRLQPSPSWNFPQLASATHFDVRSGNWPGASAGSAEPATDPGDHAAKVARLLGIQILGNRG
jgi:hypothetical protein